MAKKSNGSETPRQRALRLARLRKEVATGTYRVDAQKLAAKIVEEHEKEEH